MLFYYTSVLWPGLVRPEAFFTALKMLHCFSRTTHQSLLNARKAVRLAHLRSSTVCWAIRHHPSMGPQQMINDQPPSKNLLQLDRRQEQIYHNVLPGEPGPPGPVIPNPTQESKLSLYRKLGQPQSLHLAIASRGRRREGKGEKKVFLST